MKIALTGGGTLGHVIPALTVMEKIRNIDSASDFLYIGSVKENERDAVSSHGVRFYPVSSGKLRRYFSFENFSDIFRIMKGFFQARKILKKEKPDVLFSKGGFVSVPVVAAAHTLKIRCITHESDMTLGLATRINEKFCDKVCLGFDNGVYKDGKYVFTGNPVRRELCGIERVKGERKLLLVLGGSQGAVEINSLIYENLDEILKYCEVYHQAGVHGDFSVHREGYTQVPFIGSELASLFSRATLCVSRAGAGAVSELAGADVPMFLIPLGRGASRGDQIDNAAYLESLGKAWVMKETPSFMTQLSDIMNDDERLEAMEKAFWPMDGDKSAEKIALIILDKEKRS
ncbi:MAG: UDP-N-acetylglucosamine--N-acetylmuramyl-(pentapeptide) pyrophosphoryl-undecaprenol N-acetylglucosamine transferase [Bullifex sp.]